MSTSPTDKTAGGSPSPTRDHHRPILQSMPDTRQQSFDEIYGPPENFLEIEVCLSPKSTVFISRENSHKS
jgi:hypothetical protein